MDIPADETLSEEDMDPLALVEDTPMEQMVAHQLERACGDPMLAIRRLIRRANEIDYLRDYIERRLDEAHVRLGERDPMRPAQPYIVKL